MKATLTFTTRIEAEKFATAWSRYSGTGHTVGAGNVLVPVTIYGITDSSKAWINNYVQEANA
jgi:hypothetical protein|tara:strand:+ start:354 stop:539 length:186 start_codon:yes stop_codon:yes gene_type:complete